MILFSLLATSLAAVPDFDARWDYSDPAGTETSFRALRPALAKAGDQDTLLQLDTQIARTLGLQGKFEAAHALLDGVEKQLTDKTRTARIRYLLERGRVHNSSGDKRAAVRPLAQAWKQAQAWGLDGHAVDAGHMIAIVEGGSNGHAWNLRTLKFAAASEAPAAQRWLGSLYNNIGWDHHDAGRYELALAAFKKGVQARQKAGKPERLRVARWTVARALRSLQRCEEALPMLEGLRTEWAEVGKPSGFVFEELAECQLALGMPSQAGPWFQRAHQLLLEDAWFVKNEPERLERLRQQAALKD
jgi:tetratricopeptide (TPR) repeat protein